MEAAKANALVLRKNRKKRMYYAPVIVFASSFVMYLIALLPIFIKRGLPFFYYGDYNVQQVPFYILAHRAVRSGNFFWNWTVDLGGSMAGDFSFYLWGSPFFWLTVLFPEGAIPYLMPVLMAIKYGVAALCAFLYIRKHVYKYQYAMIGGYLYAFSGFNACNIVFNHFTDSVAFFPLYLLIFENLMDDDLLDKFGILKFSGKPMFGFMLMTAFMSIVNYYFFFGQILFLVIFFLIKYAKKDGVSGFIIRLLRAFTGGTVGILLAGFFLMQAFYGVQGNTRLDNFLTGYNLLVYPSGKLIWDIVKSVAMLPDIIGKGTLFYTSTVKNASLAAYIPMFGISGVVAYFYLNKKKKNWEKTVIIVSLIMSVIPVFNSAFSLFNSSYYARWFYMPILIMCLMTAQAAERGRTPQMKKGAAAAVLLFLLFFAVYLLPSTDDSGNIVFFAMAENNKIFIWDLVGTAVLTVFLIIVAFALPKKKRDIAVMAFVIISCIVSTYIPVRNGSSIISDRGKEKWQEQMLFNKVEVDQSDFCRGEVDSSSTNYDMVWGIPSVHCFLSTVPSEIFDFLKGTAGITRTVETNIPTERAGLKAIVSAKYYFENGVITNNRVYYNNEGTPGYVYTDTQNGFDIFENVNFIPMGFYFDYYITESEWQCVDTALHDYDLASVLIIPDDVATQIGDSLAMRELSAMDLDKISVSEQVFSFECAKRAETSCTRFETDTRGFKATTSDVSGDTLMFFSVPARKGFTCYVDGIKTPIYKADFGLMAIPVSKGIHEIDVRYTPEGLVAGLIMTAIGLLLLGLYGLVYHRNR